MARPIEYNKEDVLSKAMALFWEKGFESTSMKDLVEATGLTTRSMYNIFESKNGLFRASLEWYYEVSVKDRFEQLKTQTGLTAIRNFMNKLSSRRSENGCFFVNTASDKTNIDTLSFAIVEDYFKELEEVFKTQLEYAQKYEGYIHDPALRSKQLAIIIKGLSVQSKSDLEQNNLIVEDFLILLDINK